MFATLASLILDLRVYDTQCGAKAFCASRLLAAVLGKPFHARWAFDVELIGRLLAGAGEIPGLRATDLLEMPLRTWRDVPDSKLRFAQFPRLGMELVRRNRLPAVRVGRRIRFNKQDLIAWAAKGGAGPARGDGPS